MYCPDKFSTVQHFPLCVLDCIKKQQFKKHIITQFVYTVHFYGKIVFAVIPVGTACILYHVTFAVISLELSRSVYYHNVYFPSDYSQ